MAQFHSPSRTDLPNIDVEETASITIKQRNDQTVHEMRKTEIALHFQRTVQGFCREILHIGSDYHLSSGLCPAVIEDLISFFYAKPMNMNIEYGKKQKQIKICPIRGTWTYLQDTLMKELWNVKESLTVIKSINKFKILSHYGDFNLKIKGKSETAVNIDIGESEWEYTRWHEQDDVFIVNGSIKQTKEEPLDLVVDSHRGHGHDCPPQNLLSYSGFYASKNFWGWPPPSGDWIIFKQQRQVNFYPTKVMISNLWHIAHDAAVKSVVISRSENGKEYHKWTQIDDIKATDGEKLFNLDEKERDSVFGKLRYIKLEIVENHGDRIQNAFNQFTKMCFKSSSN